MSLKFTEELSVKTMKNDAKFEEELTCGMTSHIDRDVPDHAKTSIRRRNWYTNETDLFETSLRRLTGA